ncbi:type IV toxin-antitoxin system AbiEi family antitoxin domain-containing protein [Halobacteriovorax sp.]|uniref:type IV toxin-antitoxin system AbiEi family antitoxin domain-containing protein n=1 Tax=Halobacteriovorax sp. TaxID=2020862 RepID=UPI003563C859
MEEKLQRSQSNYLTTEYLQSLYSDLKMPRNKIASLVKKGELIPIRRGIYLHGAAYQRQYSKSVLAGLIYGPSAVSFEYALSYHGLIPERVETVTCICFKRNKEFETLVGNFSYRYIPKDLYPEGLEYHQTSLGNYFMASPEKALCDIVYFKKITSIDEALSYLLESLRIDRDELKNLSLEKLLLLERFYKRKSVVLIVDAVRSIM